MIIQGATGDPSNAIITGNIFATGAQGLTFDSLTVNGDLSIQNGAEAGLFNVILTGGANIGGSTSTGFFDSTVTGSGDFGIFGNADFFMVSSTIDNLSGSVFVTNGANARFTNTDVTNTGSQPAVGVFNDSSFRQDQSGGGSSQINGNIQVLHMSYADFRAAVITGNVEVDLESVFRLGSPDFGGDPANTALTGDSTVSRGSAFAIEDPQVTVNGQVTCLDRKSSFSGSFAGTVTFSNCTDFNGRRLRNGGDDDDD